MYDGLTGAIIFEQVIILNLFIGWDNNIQDLCTYI
jgi:hypothetical protein